MNHNHFRNLWNNMHSISGLHSIFAIGPLRSEYQVLTGPHVRDFQASKNRIWRGLRVIQNHFLGQSITLNPIQWSDLLYFEVQNFSELKNQVTNDSPFKLLLFWTISSKVGGEFSLSKFNYFEETKNIKVIGIFL